jgi:predicted transcriptional regulator
LAKKTPKKDPDFDVQKSLNEFEKLVNIPEAFSGRTSKTDRGVLLALIYWSGQCGAYTIHPGVQKIAEISGMDKRTVINSLNRLERFGWITCSYRAHPMSGKASIWNLNLRILGNTYIEPTPSNGVLNHAISNLSIWTNHGLGQNSRTIYRILVESPGALRVVALERATGLGRNAIRKCLEELNKARLVHRYKQHVMAIRHPEEQLNWVITEIYKDWNIAEKAELQANRHESERIIYKTMLRQNAINGNSKFELRDHANKQRIRNVKRRRRESSKTSGIESLKF